MSFDASKWFVASKIIWGATIAIIGAVLQATGAPAPEWLTAAMQIGGSAFVVYDRILGGDTDGSHPPLTLLPPK